MARYFFVLFLILASRVFAFEVPPLTGPVMDQVGVISPQARTSLSEILLKLNAKGKAQLQILIVETLDGTPIEQASIQAVDQWKLGSARGDNGILFLIAIKDRKARIEVGQGLEGDLPDIVASRVIREVLAPYFKEKQYSEGIIAAVFAIIQRVDPEFQFDDNAQSINPQQQLPKGALVFILFFLILIFLNRGKGGRHFRGGGMGPWGGGGFGGGWGGSSGGGWSGGGGGFSGGGASGDW